MFFQRKRRTGKAASLIAIQLNVIYYGLIVIIVMTILSSLSIASLVIGITKQNQCPIQGWIPRWLIIFGSVGLGGCVIFIIMAIIKMTCCYTEKYCKSDTCIKYGTCFLLLFFIFFFSWMIAGSVWVFSVRTKVQCDRLLEADYCQKLLYNMAFGCILGQYAFMGLILCCTACRFAIIKIFD